MGDHVLKVRCLDRGEVKIAGAKGLATLQLTSHGTSWTTIQTSDSIPQASDQKRSGVERAQTSLLKFLAVRLKQGRHFQA